MLKVYLAVPIIRGRDLDKAKAIASIISGVGHEVTSPWVLNENPGFALPAHEVFRRDLAAVEASNSIVAEVTWPSHGVGMEVMAAYFYGMQIILLKKSDVTVSRMLVGIPRVTVLEYTSLEEMSEKLKGLLRSQR